VIRRLRMVLPLLLAVVLVASCAGAPATPGDATRQPTAEPDAAGLEPTASPSTSSSSRVRSWAGRVGRLHYRFPVRGATAYSRAHHDYPATDIFAGCRARVRAPVRAVVLELSRRDRYRPRRDDPALRGGRFVSLRGADGVRYYGSHLRSVAGGLRAGRRVRAGQTVGRVGTSGNARGTGCHLHFGISPVCSGTGDWRVRRGTVRPYPFLRAWQQGRDRSPRAAVRRWRAEHGCRA
jgi:peptidoglycan LD-endopeptidase LytH